MTQPDGGQSPYDPPQQPEQGSPATPPPAAASGQPAPYQQAPYQSGPHEQAPQDPAFAQPGQPYPYGAAPLSKNSLGVWSLVLGILSVLGCGILTGIAAIITGSKSRRAQQEGLADNGGMGLAGLIMGWVGSVLVTLAVVGYVGFMAVLFSTPEFQQEFQQGFEEGYSQEY